MCAPDEYIVPADSGFASEDEQDEEDEVMQDGQDDEDDNMNDGLDDEDDNVEDKDKDDVYEEYENQTNDVDMLDTTSGDEENYYSENDGYSSPSDDED